MSRSFKKTPICGICKNDRLRPFKQMNNRMLRRSARQQLSLYADFDALVLPLRLDEFMDRWDYPDDGKAYFSLDDSIRFRKEHGWPLHQLMMK